MDLQRYFLKREGLEGLAEKICEFADGSAWETVTVTCFRNPGEGGFFEDRMGWGGMKSSPDIDMPPDVAALAELNGGAFWRETFGAMPCDPLRDRLLQIPSQDRVAITGVCTDVSIFAMALELADAGKTPVVISDRVGTPHGWQAHTHGLQAARSALYAMSVQTSSEFPMAG